MNYRDSIALQPESLDHSRGVVTRALDGIDLAPLGRGSIAFVGIGASLHAAIATAAHLRARRVRAHAFCPTDLYERSVDGADAYVALSASGRSRETVEAVKIRPRIPSYSVSKTADNPLAECVGGVIAIDSGEDGSPSTTSYTATLQATALLADRITGGAVDWTALPAAVASVLASTARQVSRGAEVFAGRSAIDFVGAGAALGTAGEASLLVREAVRIPTAAHDTLHFLHGPMESLDRSSGLVVFGDGREIRIARDVAAFGCPTILVTGRSDVADEPGLTVVRVPPFAAGLADAILQILPAQLLVADLADAAGLTDKGFRYRQTDTKYPAR